MSKIEQKVVRGFNIIFLVVAIACGIWRFIPASEPELFVPEVDILTATEAAMRMYESGDMWERD